MGRAGWNSYGFEVKFFHLELTHTALEDYIASLDSLGFADYILLERRNTLRKIVSSVVAHERAEFYRASGGAAQRNPVSLDVDAIQIDRNSKPLIDFL